MRFVGRAFEEKEWTKLPIGTFLSSMHRCAFSRFRLYLSRSSMHSKNVFFPVHTLNASVAYEPAAILMNSMLAFV